MKWDDWQTKFDLSGRRVIIPKPKVRKTNVQEVREIFRILNNECFENYLYEPNFIVDSLRRRNAWGLFEKPATGWPAFDPLGWKRAASSTISIDHSLSGWQLYEVVFHEMIHYFQYEAGWHDDRNHHGVLFQDDYNKRISKAKVCYLRKDNP